SPGPKLAARMWNSDAKPELKIVEQGPVRSVIEVSTHFTGLKTRPPEAIYRYTYWKDSPLIGLQILFPLQKLQEKQFASVCLSRYSFTDQNAFVHAAAGAPFVDQEFTSNITGIALCDRNVTRIWGSLSKGDIAFGLIGPNLGGIHGNDKGQTIAGPFRPAWH